VNWHLFPWPRRAERKQRIKEARAGAVRSRRQAEDAAHLQRDVRRIAYEENHWAARVAGQLHPK